jgi:hypothetical protein
MRLMLSDRPVAENRMPSLCLIGATMLIHRRPEGDVAYRLERDVRQYPGHGRCRGRPETFARSELYRF